MRDNNASLPDRLSRGINNGAEYNTRTCAAKSRPPGGQVNQASPVTYKQRNFNKADLDTVAKPDVHYKVFVTHYICLCALKGLTGLAVRTSSRYSY